MKPLFIRQIYERCYLINNFKNILEIILYYMFCGMVNGLDIYSSSSDSVTSPSCDGSSKLFTLRPIGNTQPSPKLI